jgi:hypothetical protein
MTAKQTFVIVGAGLAGPDVPLEHVTPLQEGSRA